MVALEGEDNLALVRGDESRQRHGQVVAQPDITAALVREVVHQLFVFARLAGQDFEIFERGRVDRLESVALVDAAKGFDDPAPQQHLGGQMIAKAFQHLRPLGPCRCFRAVAQSLVSFRLRVSPSRPRFSDA